MFNVGGGELLVIFLVALIVLGPAKLPEVARQIGGVMREVRRISSGFQDEMRAAMDDPVEAAARERGNRVVATSESPAPAGGLGDELLDEDDPDHPSDSDDDADDDTGIDESAPDDADAAREVAAPPAEGAEGAPMSTAAAAGMYDVAPPPKESTPNPYLAPVGTRAQPADTADGDGDADDTMVTDRPGDGPGEPDDEASEGATGER